MDIQLNPDQQRAFNTVMDFIGSNHGQQDRYITLGGYAGTGKTTLISKLAEKLKQGGHRLAFCTISGKASSVLRSKISHIINEKEDYCGTIHSLIYRFIGKHHKTNKPMFENKGSEELYDVVFIDESSMVNRYIFDDIMDIPFAVKIFVGDHGQLPPVGDSFNIMESPIIRLEKIVRQAENNPIIKVSMMARESGVIPHGTYGDNSEVIKTKEGSFISKFDLSKDDIIVLTSNNRERNNINSYAREKLSFNEAYPSVGDKIVCLMNNNKLKVYNGQLGRVTRFPNKKEIVLANVRRFDKEQKVYTDNQEYVECYLADYKINDNENDVYDLPLLVSQFGSKTTLESSLDYNLFDYGYCLTVWKAQGSEWNTVILLESGEQWIKDNWNKFLYTAVTRAKEKLIIIKK